MLLWLQRYSVTALQRYSVTALQRYHNILVTLLLKTSFYKGKNLTPELKHAVYRKSVSILLPLCVKSELVLSMVFPFVMKCLLFNLIPPLAPRFHGGSKRAKALYGLKHSFTERETELKSFGLRFATMHQPKATALYQIRTRFEHGFFTCTNNKAVIIKSFLPPYLKLFVQALLCVPALFCVQAQAFYHGVYSKPSNVCMEQSIKQDDADSAFKNSLNNLHLAEDDLARIIGNDKLTNKYSNKAFRTDRTPYYKKIAHHLTTAQKASLTIANTFSKANKYECFSQKYLCQTPLKSFIKYSHRLSHNIKILIQKLNAIADSEKVVLKALKNQAFKTPNQCADLSTIISHAFKDKTKEVKVYKKTQNQLFVIVTQYNQAKKDIQNGCKDPNTPPPIPTRLTLTTPYLLPQFKRG